MHSTEPKVDRGRTSVSDRAYKRTRLKSALKMPEVANFDTEFEREKGEAKTVIGGLPKR